MKLLHKFAWLFGSALTIFLTSQFLAAQTGPTVFTPQLTVSPGFLRVLTGPTTVQDLTIQGTCTGCTATPPGGATTQVQYNNAGTFAGDAGMTYNAGTDTLTLGTALIVPNVSATGNQTVGPVGANTLTLQTNTVPRLTFDGAGAATFAAIPAFNGGTSGVSAPFSVDSNFLVSSLNADLLDDLSSAAFAQLAQANTFTVAPQIISAATPQEVFIETGAAVDNRRWRCVASIEQYSCGTRNDANNAGASYLIIDRTGTTVDSVALAGTAITLNGVNATDFARLSQANVFTTDQFITSTGPSFLLNETDAATNEKIWRYTASGGTLTFNTRTDANGAGNNFITVDRTGTTVDSIALTATATTVSGTLAATGTATFNDGIAIATGGGVTEASCTITVASGTVNNFDVFAGCSPTGPHAIVRLTPDAAVSTTLTGMVLPDNQIVHFVVVDPGSGLIGIDVSGENASSTATNRFINPNQSATCTFNRGDSFVAWKDPVSSRVRIMNGDGDVCGA